MNAKRAMTQFTAAVLIGLACAAPNARAVDADGDGVEDALENELMRRFAPIVRLHPDDEYRPVSVDWYLARVVMWFNHNNCWDCPDGTAGWPTSELVTRSHPTKNPVCEHNYDNLKYSWNTTPSPSDVSHFFLQIPNDGNEETTRRGDLSTAVCYAHVRRAARHPGMFDIQYWFFYAYNGAVPFVGHEGDWEHITVRVEQDGQTIHRIFYDAHDISGQWYSEATSSQPFGYYLVNGRPLVYSAYHSHASYVGALVWPVKPAGADETAEGGPVWDCLSNLVNVGEGNAPSPGCDWIQFTGHWGEVGPVGNGPEGPAFKSKWSREYPEEGVCLHDIFVAQSNPPPGNGSYPNPFHEFTDGVDAVVAGGTVWIFPGIYPAVGLYTKPMTLRAMSGGVTLGP